MSNGDKVVEVIIRQIEDTSDAKDTAAQQTEETTAKPVTTRKTGRLSKRVPLSTAVVTRVTNPMVVDLLLANGELTPQEAKEGMMRFARDSIGTRLNAVDAAALHSLRRRVNRAAMREAPTEQADRPARDASLTVKTMATALKRVKDEAGAETQPKEKTPVRSET